MKLTPLAFLDSAERMLKDALPAALPAGGDWSFQRVLNLVEQSGSLQIFRQAKKKAPGLVAVIHVRVTRSARESFIQGWIQAEGTEERAPFVLREAGGVRTEEEIFGLVESWIAFLSAP